MHTLLEARIILDEIYEIQQVPVQYRSRDCRKPVSARFCAVRVDDTLNQRGKDLFLKKEFELAIVDGRRRRFGFQKLAYSGEQGAEWASQPIRVTVIEAPALQFFNGHEILKLSRSAKVMSGLLLRDTSLMAVIKSIVQLSETLESSCDVFFDRACKGDTCRNLVSREYVLSVREPVYRL